MSESHLQTNALNAQIPPALVDQAMALIQSATRIALLAHEHPDGDCLGSALGLAQILRQFGKDCVACCADPAPRMLSFLPGANELRQDLQPEDFDLVIALDAGDLTRFGSLYSQHQAFLARVPILTIDHHLSSSGCGLVNIIDPTAAATGELLTLFQQQANLPLPKEAAICLLTGLITDTNSFQFTNTTPRSLEVGALLLRAGAVPETIVQPIYRTRPLAQEKLRAAVMLASQTACDGRLIWSQADSATLASTGALAEMDDNLSGLLRDVEGVQIAAYFKNYTDSDTTRLSLRCAAPYNAAEICQRLGQGGGHARAAGATLSQPLAVAVPLAVAELKRELLRSDNS